MGPHFALHKSYVLQCPYEVTCTVFWYLVKACVTVDRGVKSVVDLGAIGVINKDARFQTVFHHVQ